MSSYVMMAIVRPQAIHASSPPDEAGGGSLGGGLRGLVAALLRPAEGLWARKATADE